MKRTTLAMATVTVAIGLMAAVLVAQQPRPGMTRRPQTGQRPGGQQPQEEEEAKYVPPADPRLLEIHKQFVMNSEKLANELIAKNKTDEAREALEGILRLAPNYQAAKDGLAKINEKQATADRKVIDIYANRAWQDTGIVVEEGRPLVIGASGSWKINMSYDLTADGIEIPEELRNFNIGSLVGRIDDGNTSPEEAKVFLVGANREVRADRTGKLMLRMYDADPQDNVGKLSVTITGTFAK